MPGKEKDNDYRIQFAATAKADPKVQALVSTISANVNLVNWINHVPYVSWNDFYFAVQLKQYPDPTIIITGVGEPAIPCLVWGLGF